MNFFYLFNESHTMNEIFICLMNLTQRFLFTFSKLKSKLRGPLMNSNEIIILAVHFSLNINYKNNHYGIIILKTLFFSKNQQNHVCIKI